MRDKIQLGRAPEMEIQGSTTIQTTTSKAVGLRTRYEGLILIPYDKLYWQYIKKIYATDLSGVALKKSKSKKM